LHQRLGCGVAHYREAVCTLFTKCNGFQPSGPCYADRSFSNANRGDDRPLASTA
jgi:hypothetical protein